MFIKKFIFSTYLKIKHFFISISQFKDLHLMDGVYYNNKKCFINNAVKSDNFGNRLYDIVEKEWREDGNRNSYCVKANELKKIYSQSTIDNSLFHHYRWWRMYWYGINLREMLNKSK